MRLLHVVYIGSVPYQIVEVQNLSSEGLWDLEHRVISVKAGQSKRARSETLVHEIMHAYCHHYGITQVIDDQSMEILCESVAQLMNELFDLRLKKPTSIHLNLQIVDHSPHEPQIRPIGEESQRRSETQAADEGEKGSDQAQA